MTVGERIKFLREKLNISQVDFANKINVSKQTLYKYENDIITNIPFDKIEAIAKVCDISPSDVMGWTINCKTATLDVFRDYKMVDTIPVTMDMTNDNFFAVEITDDCMEPRIKYGDYVIARKQTDGENGDIVIIKENNNLNCKRLKKYAEGIMLLSNNQKYDPILISAQDIAEEKVRIIGKVVELRRKI